jgi:hypothetical protein
VVVAPRLVLTDLLQDVDLEVTIGDRLSSVARSCSRSVYWKLSLTVAERLL